MGSHRWCDSRGGTSGRWPDRTQNSGSVDPVLAPKVRGTRILEKLLKRPAGLPGPVLVDQRDPLSSRPVDYSAANLFLDAFAVSKHALEGTRVVSIRWDAWKETGMAVNLTVPDRLRPDRAKASSRGLATRKEPRRCGGS